MELSVQDHFLNFVKLFVTQHVAANHALKVCVDPTIGERWAYIVFLQALALLMLAFMPIFVGFHANPFGLRAHPFGLSAPPCWPSCPSFWL